MLSVATDGRHKQKNCVRQRLVLIESQSCKNMLLYAHRGSAFVLNEITYWQ